MKANDRFSYGWVVVATSALGLLFGAFPIVVSSFTIFFKSYLDEFHAGRGAISLALTVHNLFAALLAAYIGRQADRFGAKKVILPGLGMLALVLLCAQAIGSKVWQLYLFYSALGIVSSTTTSVPYGIVVSRSNRRARIFRRGSIAESETCARLCYSPGGVPTASLYVFPLTAAARVPCVDNGVSCANGHTL